MTLALWHLCSGVERSEVKVTVLQIVQISCFVTNCCFGVKEKFSYRNQLARQHPFHEKIWPGQLGGMWSTVH